MPFENGVLRKRDVSKRERGDTISVTTYSHELVMLAVLERMMKASRLGVCSVLVSVDFFLQHPQLGLFLLLLEQLIRAAAVAPGDEDRICDSLRREHDPVRKVLLDSWRYQTLLSESHGSAVWTTYSYSGTSQEDSAVSRQDLLY